MSEFFEKVKENAVKTKDEAVKIGKQVLDKANNMVGQTKLNFAINDAEGKIKDIYTQMGKSVYQKHLSGESICSCMEDGCEQIDKLFEEIGALKEQLAELKDSVQCPVCGAYNKQESMFCSKCGSPVINAQKNEEAPAKTEDLSDSFVDDEEEAAPETVKRVITIKAKRPEPSED